MSSGRRIEDDAEAARERERAEKKVRCQAEKQKMEQVFTGVNEYGRLPKKSQFTTQPYIKGKLFLIQADDKSFSPYDYASAGCVLSDECRETTGCSFDKFAELRARSADEVQSVAVISCHKVKHGDYVPASGSNTGERIPGYDMVCELSLVDRTIPAVIYQKTFKSELIMLEDDTSTTITGKKELVAGVPHREMDSFLLGLPRK